MFLVQTHVLAVELDYCASAPQERPSDSKEMISGSSLAKDHKTILGLTIDENSFADVEKRFGSINVVRPEPGCASCGEEACYRSIDGKMAIFFHRYTSWDFLGFDVTSLKHKVAKDYCAPTKLVTVNTSTVSGLRLGLNRKEVVALLGKPLHESQYIYQYDYHKLVRLPVEQIRKAHDSVGCSPPCPLECDKYYCDASGTVVATFDEEGKLVDFSVSYMVSC